MTELQKAQAYERKLQRDGFLKNIQLYTSLLDNYAQEHGFYSFDELITELSND